MARSQLRRRQRTTERLADLHHDLRRDLETGHPFFGGFKTREDFDATWQAVGDELVAEWIEKHPGRRPFGWWLEHGIERPIVQTGPDPAVWRRNARFGFLHTRLYGGPEMTSWQEGETVYLDRHGLLEDGELERALSGDYDQ